MPQPSPPPNADQIAAWNDAAGPTWVKYGEALDRQLEPHGLAAMQRAGLAAGQRVLDVGCGGGATTLEIAGRVAPNGSVLGVDVSQTLLERARERARAAGLSNASFQCADAQTHAFQPAAFDAVFSRFGVMFFDDPAAAFSNLRRAARPGARLAFVCWRGLAENPWMSAPVRAAADVVPPQPPAPPGAPGPFAFAEPAHVAGVLAQAGWTGVDIESLYLEMGGSDLETTTAVMMRMGHLGAALREAGASPELMARVEPRVREALLPWLTDDGVVMMPSACWIVTARA
ncbi:MAG TPA: class I SAM-dependent methyltransferase [Caulobacteraceae bacterium]|jgi:SAM-dependent methyltransferase